MSMTPRSSSAAAAWRDALFEPTFYFPFWNESLFAVPWGNWYASGGKSGEEPPAEVKKQMDLYREITKYSDPAKQKELMKQLLDIAADQFYAIGISTPGPLYSPRQEQPCTTSIRGRSPGPIRARSPATPSSTTSILRNDAER